MLHMKMRNPLSQKKCLLEEMKRKKFIFIYPIPSIERYNITRSVLGILLPVGRL